MKLLVFGLVLVLSLAVALFSRGGSRHDEVHDYFVASRQFGSLLLFFLSVGECYSLGVLTAFPGGVFVHGLSFAMWFMSYILLAFPIGYFLGPLIWRAAQRHDPVTLADLFRAHFGSRALEITVAATAILFLVPWGTIQFIGLAMVLQNLGIGLSPRVLMLGSLILSFVYTVMSGIRAPAYVSIVKDVLLIVAIVAVGLAAISRPGGWHAIRHAGEAMAATPLTAHELRFAFSSILFQALGLHIFPVGIASFFTARSAKTIQRAMVLMPLYMLMFPILIVVTLYARSVPGLVEQPNHVFIDVARTLLSPFALGLVAGGAALSGLIVLAGICLVIGPLFTRNILTSVPVARQKPVAQVVGLGYLVCSIIGAETVSSLAATMNNLTYFGITQFLPGILVIGRKMPVSARAVLLGIVAGDVVSIGLFIGNVDIVGLNDGFLGLIVNVAILSVSALMRRHPLRPA
ncbi:Na+/solute symporter [Ameyamaea chiangmaiensis NBRC 103196]|uniref:Sodium:solute symporter family protein n=1 Tax=Ameyamaea chiangmaiensis TaxID=442969 RepID=A0A850P6C3_9PROT|nr:sodium:solute symporter family protein [Ameyamaea chiangmaiensis]MBS4075147.1 sodium:solute symporter family protein [Ameyamaea chiangmaiensis]NVN40195.1 sodium:solute symporter family protein [Ameyamaea chiangmaiensis]GBQ66233.1 Na+/solute symporter [Ameyamaea chiangmaiensis NBRC 103196]